MHAKFATLALAVCATTTLAQDAVTNTVETAPTLAPITDRFVIDNLWLLIAAALVFVMHLGFASLEAGLTRAKNTVNILFKNSAIIAIGLLTYLFIGFNLMYPGSDDNWLVLNWLGAIGMATPPADGTGMTPDYEAYSYWADFIFQAMFAATAATIVSGAVAERIKLGPFLIFSVLYVAVIYPIVGSWKWGTGFLDDLGFYDFAGSTLVHSVGGWGALAGVIVLGPRLGKYVKRDDGTTEIRPLMGHSMPLAAIGVFLLWFGWFGFNGGSVLSADPGAGYGFKGVGLVFVTTSMAAAAGIVGAMVTSWIWTKQPDLSMTLNGALAGLVGITAGADVISVPHAVIIGLVAGVLVVVAVTLLDRTKLDDPVGAISVHLVCGIWGTLAVGLFGNTAALGEGTGTLVAQLIGIGATAAICFPAALLFFYALKLTVGLRVPREEELMGLDVGEHGMEAYAGFQIFTTQ
ncbi:MAG: ammonium transporter [Planctomycetota bacterium]